mmetsp:Transcript_73865/g.209202  ORF Transcript_73865/g.209202 Transcript_73865/m.209202 type:complete len:126 (-) Transcript_73865:8-385(-)
MAVNIFLTAVSVLCSQGMRVKEGSTGIIYEYNITGNSACSMQNPVEVQEGEDVAGCEAYCNAREWCKGFTLDTRDTKNAICMFTEEDLWSIFTFNIDKDDDDYGTLFCYARIEAPTPPPTKACTT